MMNLFLVTIFIFLLNFMGEGHGNLPQYSCLENPMDGGATVHGVARSLTLLSSFTFTFHFHALEQEMATLSSILAWRIPGIEEPGGHTWKISNWSEVKSREVSHRREKEPGSLDLGKPPKVQDVSL